MNRSTKKSPRRLDAPNTAYLPACGVGGGSETNTGAPKWSAAEGKGVPLKGGQVRISGPHPQLNRASHGPNGVLLPRSFGQRQIAEGESRAQRHQAVGEAELDVLPAIDDLIERSASRAGLLGQQVALLHREG
ncbi:hypothetical protein GmRootV15_28340 [Variovorax sp. V15]